jgi:hypothetical protein
MTTLRNNFDGGPNSTVLTVANSDQVPINDAFDVVSTQGSGATLQYRDASALDRGTAEFVLHCATTGTAASEGVSWSTSMGTQTQIWLRFYLRMPILPAGAGLNPSIFECDNGVAFTGSIDIQPNTGLVKIWNGPGTVSAVASNSLVADEWCRIEAHFTYSTTAGSAELRLYLEADSDTETESISWSGSNSGAANSNSFAFGYPFSRANQPTIYLSGLELNNVGWPGPAPYKVKGVPGIQPSPVAIHTW